ncbi:hypothetical protein V6N12_050823 [Hibiscus sabdariffa]|uniref:RNase H type-1 domain-containing protein n=1 Tax=Hibiscus sabdariffa TaxID=183260 RepID=A0ABR2GDP4_9ROSI
MHWCKPPKGWWKLNSDGAVATSSGLSSCGSVIRDADVDSAVVVDLIHNYNSDETTFSLIPYIASLLHRSWQVEIKHVLRKGNEAADSMAKLVCLDDFICHRFLSPTDFLRRRVEGKREDLPFDVG